MVNKSDTPLYGTRDEGYYDVDNPGGEFGTEEPDSTPGSSSFWANNPNEKLGFEINPIDTDYAFTPEFYPEDFTFVKKRELKRYGGNCDGESVSIKAVKNREFHARGLMTTEDLAIFNHLVDHSDEVDIISPKIPGGGMECFVKKGEVGNQKGVDPLTTQRIFEYSLDLVSTGADEYSTGENQIVSAILGSEDSGSGSGSEDGPSITDDPARDITISAILEEAGLSEEFSPGSSQRRILGEEYAQNYWIAGESPDDISSEIIGLSDSDAESIIEATITLVREARGEDSPYPLEDQNRFVPEE